MENIKIGLYDQNKIFFNQTANRFASASYAEAKDYNSQPSSFSQNDQILDTDVNWGILRVCLTNNPFED
jgi:hypothetical protein